MVEERDVELKILRAELVDQSYKTHRLENGGDLSLFPVRLWFTRRLDPYERLELANHGLELEFSDRDPRQAIVFTTADFLGSVIDNVSRGLPVVVEDARRLRAAAVAEDEHLVALIQQINLRLNPEQ
jgi:hypothetical protein